MKKLLIVLLFILLFPVNAQEETPAAADESITGEAQAPLSINIGIFVVGMSEFDLEQGLYAVDYYLFLTCNRECSDDEIAMDYVGISGTFSLEIELRNREPAYAEYRIQAILSQNDINLRRFPFDSHHLNIILEAKFYTVDDVIFAADPADSNVDEQVNLPGWEINHDFQIELVEKDYFEDSAGYARLIYSVELHRTTTAAVIRSILPALVILVISLLSSFIPDLSQRSGIAGGILLALLLHHLSVANGIPQVAYPVYFDAFMLINNALILLQFALTVGEIALERRQVLSERREKIALRLLICMSLLWLIGQGLLILLFLL